MKLRSCLVVSPTGNSSTAGGRPEEGDGASSRGEPTCPSVSTNEEVYFEMTLIAY